MERLDSESDLQIKYISYNACHNRRYGTRPDIVKSKISDKTVGNKKNCYERIESDNKKTDVPPFKMYRRSKCPFTIHVKTNKRLSNKSNSTRKKIMKSEEPGKKPNKKKTLYKMRWT